ncbi:39S ribosomal L49, mitochondrial [Lecanosticta acicola]|uniref:Large ribosomal subunit protein mL49 n=1 Tax=Lecanosticta acicola TaxID=111012 RepID=A0AAI8YWW4_9PEZI|nr:39S ribosomal L49, mitochondrial [Lecanosticta acicola]
MASSTPVMSFLRPLRLPRPSTVRHFLRFSTSAPCSEATQQQKEDPNLIASRTAPEAYPPPSIAIRSNPRPKESRASRRTSFPMKQRQYPTRVPSHHQPETPKLIPEPVELLPPEQCAPNLPYFVTRSRKDELPIYTLRKRGGNLKMTRVKRIDGETSVLRDELRQLLRVGAKDAVINHTTGHIMIKGHFKPQIEQYLRQRNF